MNILDTSDDEDSRYQAVVAYHKRMIYSMFRFIELLSDNNLEIRECAAKFLGEVGDEKAVEPLVRTLVDSQNMKYIGVSGQIGSEIALEPLVELLEELTKT